MGPMPEPLQNQAQLPPPGGDPEKAERYLNKLTQLIDSERLKVSHTDLAEFDPSALQDHYYLDFKDYRVEVSHSKHPQNGQDSYVMLFTNLKQVQEGCTEKIILAYLHLNQGQYQRFKHAADTQENREKKKIEEARLKEAMEPIDQALDELVGSTPSTTENHFEEPKNEEDSQSPQPVAYS